MHAACVLTSALAGMLTSGAGAAWSVAWCAVVGAMVRADWCAVLGAMVGAMWALPGALAAC